MYNYYDEVLKSISDANYEGNIRDAYDNLRFNPDVTGGDGYSQFYCKTGEEARANLDGNEGLLAEACRNGFGVVRNSDPDITDKRADSAIRMFVLYQISRGENPVGNN